MNTFVVPKGASIRWSCRMELLVWMNAESSLRFPEEFTRDKRGILGWRSLFPGGKGFAEAFPRACG